MTQITTTFIFLIFLILLLLFLMPDRPPYSQVIKQWSKLFNLKIRYSSRFSDHFEVDVIDNILYISRYNKAFHSKQEWLFSLAHELGHLIDHAYRDYYNKHKNISNTEANKRAIYNDEVRAWRIAKVLLEQRNLLDLKAFNKYKNKCLLEYRQHLKLGKYSDNKQ